MTNLLENHPGATLALPVEEQTELARLESVIERGKETFIEVGTALCRIRDARLYRATNGSFQCYCEARWNFSRVQAHRLIEAANVVALLPIGNTSQITNEAQARALARVPEELRVEVLEAATERGPVTAAAITEIAAERTPGGKPAPKPTIPPPPAAVVDSTGWPIPSQLIVLWRESEEVQEMLAAISKIRGALRTAQDTKRPLFFEVNFSSALAQLDQAYTDIKTAKPFAVCPSCQGQLPDKCRLCYGRGLISEYRWNTVVPREDKELRFKVKGMKK